jgi:hypothetical protein
MYKRGSGKINADYKSKDLYKFYKDKYNDVNYVSQTDYNRIIKEFNNEIIKLVIYDSMEFILPFRLGTLRIKRRKVEPKLDCNGNIDARNLSPNWKKTKALWQKQYPELTFDEMKSIPNKHIIRELNIHSDNYRYSWYWDKVISNIPNQNAYKINITRTHDQELSNAIKTIPNLEYYD